MAEARRKDRNRRERDAEKEVAGKSRKVARTQRFLLVFVGITEKRRESEPSLTNQLLYQLSYAG
jgi:hypothetical protein